MFRFRSLAAVMLLAGCVDALQPAPAPRPRPLTEAKTRAIAAVVDRVEPVARAMCRSRGRSRNCDFRIVVDARPGQPPNAYQSRNDRGRPIITFTSALLSETENADEMAFVLGHEAGHHIAGHLDRTADAALAGAVMGGLLATLAGSDPAMADMAQNLGATVGARRYSKEFELQADRLGTIIAFRAGYDPLRGAAFFDRLPDPGNRFLGTHPPNRQRLKTVQKTVAGLE